MDEEAKKVEMKGKKIVEGPTIYFWVLSIITGLGLFSLNFGNWMGRDFHIGPFSIGLPSPNTSFIFVALFVAALVGLYIRKSWAVPVGRAGLVVSMVIFFPVGTIFGAILWKRYNDPEAKKYLNYVETAEKDKDDGPEKTPEINTKNDAGK
ncbi:MAG: hypothetical protein FJW68_08825 [Actinobacteria bacterium]|nr:hypothetical protein [Actinomycetota bacterium]